MKVTIRKISHTEFELSTEMDDKTTTNVLDTKTFLKHDLTHRAIELALETSSYNTLVYDAETERLAGILHDLKREDVVEERLSGIYNMWQAYGEIVPEYISIEFIIGVRDTYAKMLDTYQSLKTGESKEI